MDYSGLDTPSYKKKRRNKGNNTAKDTAQEANHSVVSREGDILSEPTLTTEANVIMIIP